MCGIFGFCLNRKARFTSECLKRLLRDLFLFSESRGKEAAGLAALGADAISVLKAPMSASAMLRTPEYEAAAGRALQFWNREGNVMPSRSLTMIGHSRLVTTGSQDLHCNNQPVIADGLVGVHNGIIVNQDDLWRRFPQVTRQYEVDTEVMLRLLRLFYAETGSVLTAVRRAFEVIQGATSVAILFTDLDLLLLATNNGSLYRCWNEDATAFIFASERHILRRLLERRYVSRSMGQYSIAHIRAGTGCLVNTQDAAFESFELNATTPSSFFIPSAEQVRTIADLDEPKVKRATPALNVGAGLILEQDAETKQRIERLRERFPYDTRAADTLRRCTKCILPETMPFIEFDEQGVCNYCRFYLPIPQAGRAALEELAARHRRCDGEPDCVVGISGGRDSLYGLHYLKTQLGLNPVAYTYDWGMVTDIARRNAARVCGKLGIEHILVSADITRKREFIRKNVAAWLKRPSLGTIPLFMAGDKQYFYYLQHVRKQLGVDLMFLCENMLERTDFKSGYAGVGPFNRDRYHVYTLPLWSKMRIGAFYAKEYMLNPAYLNASVWDTLWAYACYYLIDRAIQTCTPSSPGLKRRSSAHSGGNTTSRSPLTPPARGASATAPPLSTITSTIPYPVSPSTTPFAAIRFAKDISHVRTRCAGFEKRTRPATRLLTGTCALSILASQRKTCWPQSTASPNGIHCEMAPALRWLATTRNAAAATASAAVAEAALLKALSRSMLKVRL